jgi:hypothetical protein
MLKLLGSVPFYFGQPLSAALIVGRTEGDLKESDQSNEGRLFRQAYRDHLAEIGEPGWLGNNGRVVGLHSAACAPLPHMPGKRQPAGPGNVTTEVTGSGIFLKTGKSYENSPPQLRRGCGAQRQRSRSATGVV